MTVPPAVKFPQSIELRGVVHPLSEYTPQFADVDTAPLESTLGDFVTTPVESTCVWLVRAAKVVTDKASPIITNATTTTVVFDSLRFEATLGVVVGIIGFDAVPGSFDFKATTAAFTRIGTPRTNVTTAVFVKSFRFDIITLLRQCVCCKSNLCSKS